MSDELLTLRWVVALRNETKHDHWNAKISSLPGVNVIGQNSRLARIEANIATIEKVRALLGDDFLIEENIVHRTC